MAIQVNRILTMGAGIVVPSGSIVVPVIHIPHPVPYKDEKGNTQYNRLVTYDLFYYQNEAEYLKDVNGNKRIYVNELPSGYEKKLDKKEYGDLFNSMSRAEIFLRNHLNSLLNGDYCEIIDLTV